MTGGSKTYIPKYFYRTGGSTTYIPKNFYTRTTYITLSEKFGGSGAPPRPLYPSPLPESNIWTQFHLWFLLQWSGDFVNIYPPQVVWSANRDYAVSYGALLNFTATGDLVLGDVDGSTVWSTNTTGKSVIGTNLTDTGNLVLFDVNGFVVWQSFH
ncbi:putative bulb-type lectin domain-containing protein [Helianthus anomalus]